MISPNHFFNPLLTKHMGIRLRCKDYGYDCEFISESDDAEQVMKEFGKHSDEEHGIWYSDESLKQIVQNKYNIK